MLSKSFQLALLIGAGLNSGVPAQVIKDSDAWARRIEDATLKANQRRLEAIDAHNNRRESQLRNSPVQATSETSLSDSVMRDTTLQNGDIISTVRGLYVYVGNGASHEQKDFVPVKIR